MTEMTMPAGPPCDICEDEPAVASLMNYSDYSQMRLGTNCAPAFLHSVARAIGGEPEPEPEQVEPDPKSSSGSADAGQDSTSMASSSDNEDEPGSAKDHWASTTKVVRSTHGHRTPRASSGRPAPKDPDQ